MTEDSGASPGTMPVAGEHHARLNPFEGTFRAVVRIWTGGDEPMVSSGTMTNTWQIDGLYLHQDYVGDAVDGPYPAFCGKGYWGYNTGSGQYEGFWIDNASTTMQMEYGEVDESGKVWTMYSEIQHPQAGTMKKRTVITLVDNDHHKMEAYFTGADGNEMKAMELAYVRT